MLVFQIELTLNQIHFSSLLGNVKFYFIQLNKLPCVWNVATVTAEFKGALRNPVCFQDDFILVSNRRHLHWIPSCSQTHCRKKKSDLCLKTTLGPQGIWIRIWDLRVDRSHDSTSHALEHGQGTDATKEKTLGWILYGEERREWLNEEQHFMTGPNHILFLVPVLVWAALESWLLRWNPTIHANRGN